MVGTVLNHYRIVKALGSGGMGDVYAAEDTRLKRTVAVKVLPALVAHDPERRDRFEREAQTIAALNHPNIVTIHSIEFAGDVPFLTMELVEGKTLAEIVPKGGLRPEKLLPIAVALADAIAAAHQRGVVHRDLKPANVMIATDGRVKVLDFGLAKLKEEASAAPGVTMMPTQALTGEGRIVGTVAYMAPEQAEGKTVDGRSDIFSLGVLLFELATGQRPFRGDTSLSILSSIMKDTPASVTDLNSALPKELGRIVKHCLAKDPLRRYQSAVDLRNDLEELKQEIDSGTQASAIVSAPVKRPEKSRVSVVMAGALATALVAAGLVGYAVWSRGRTPSGTAAPANAATGLAAAPSRRMAVGTIENRTGDRSLDSLSAIASDSLVQGLTETGLVDVVPAASATTLVAGAYYLQGDQIEFQIRFVNPADGKPVHAFAPVSGPRTSPRAAIDSLRQWVMGAAAMQADPKMDGLQGGYLPQYDTYREFAAGVEVFGSDYPQATRHLQRAFELDPQFVAARLLVAVVQGNENQYEQAASTLAPLVEQRNRLDAIDRLWVDWYQAELRGRRADALRLLLEMEKLAPHSFLVNYNIGHNHEQANRPRAVLETFAKLPYPEWMTRTGFSGWRFGVAARARHFLADYDGELKEGRAAVRVAPQSLPNHAVEARALIGLGRTVDALRTVDEILALPGSAGATMLEIAREFRAHGQRQASLDLARRTVSWYRNRPPDVAASRPNQAGLANAWYTAERWDEAHEAYEALSKQFPDNIDGIGSLGVVAARRGDRAEAMKWSEALRRLDRPYLFGSHTFWRARIAAVLGDPGAVDLLRDAFAQGMDFSISIHRTMDFESLAENASFRELMRPKG